MSNPGIEADDYPKIAGRPWWRISNVVSIAIVMALIGLGVRAYLGLQNAALLAACRPRLLTWVCDKYGTEHNGLYPPLSPTPGRLTFAESVEFRLGYVDFLCEADPDANFEGDPADARPIDDTSYIYLGYVIENQAQLELFAEAYRRVVAEGGNFENDIPVPSGQGTCGGDKLIRMVDGRLLPERFPELADRLHEIPLIIEWPGHHRGGKAKYISLKPRVVPVESGGKKSFTGTDEIRVFPGEWPMTEAAIAVLRSLDALGRVP